MEFLTYQESVAWCRSRKYPVTLKNYYGYPQPAVCKKFTEIQLGFPLAANFKMSIAKRVIRWMAQHGELLLWIDDWGQGAYHAPPVLALSGSVWRAAAIHSGAWSSHSRR